MKVRKRENYLSTARSDYKWKARKNPLHPCQASRLGIPEAVVVVPDDNTLSTLKHSVKQGINNVQAVFTLTCFGIWELCIEIPSG